MTWYVGDNRDDPVEPLPELGRLVRNVAGAAFAAGLLGGLIRLAGGRPLDEILVYTVVLGIGVERLIDIHQRSGGGRWWALLLAAPTLLAALVVGRLVSDSLNGRGVLAAVCISSAAALLAGAVHVGAVTALGSQSWDDR